MLENFMAITGAGQDQAVHYLEMAGGNLENAVNLFMEMGPAAVTATSSTGVGAGGGGGAGVPASTSHGMPAQPSAHSSGAGGYGYGGAMSDEALAASLAAEDDGEEHVRAPDAVKRQRLMDDGGGVAYARGSGHGHGGGGIHGHGTFRDYGREASSAGGVRPGGVFSGGGGGRPLNPKDEKLADLFRPPHEIMHKGDFLSARQKAKTECKWLMVNIQCEKEFDSHRLNRDTWKDDTLQNILSYSCVFWQQYDTTDEGSHYVQRYKVPAENLPHIALLDPRTGGIRWQLKGFQSAEKLADKVSDFCDRYTLEPEPTPTPAPAPASTTDAPSANGGSSSASSASASSAAPASSSSAAAAPPPPATSALSANLPIPPGGTGASVGSGGAASSSSSAEGPEGTKPSGMPSTGGVKLGGSSSGDGVTLGGAGEGEGGGGAGESGEGGENGEHEFAKVELPPAPAADGADATRIMFRMPDAPPGAEKNPSRYFNKTDLVEAVFKYVEDTASSYSVGRRFDIKGGFPPKSFRGKLKSTVADADLANSRVTVHWLE